MAIARQEFMDRIGKSREWMSSRGVEAMFITPGDNFFYLTGLKTEPMERLTAFILTQESAVMICPIMLEEQVQEASWVKDVRTWKDGQDPYVPAGEALGKAVHGKIGIEGSLPYSIVMRLSEIGAGRVETVDEFLTSLRMVKSGEELDLISEAVSRSEKAYSMTISEAREGITEAELAGLLEYNYRKAGLDGLAFNTIAAFGSNAAIPHHNPSGRKLEKGRMLLMDFGGAYGGYSSDTTRTVAFGEPSEKMKSIYEAVRNSQVSTIESVAAGTRLCDIDATARRIITDAGYGEQFIHRVGHGLGIAVHEEPYLIPANTSEIAEGTVFTVEPGIYFRGEGGVRIEDTIAFRNGKAVPFNRLEKDLVIL